MSIPEIVSKKIEQIMKQAAEEEKARAKEMRLQAKILAEKVQAQFIHQFNIPTFHIFHEEPEIVVAGDLRFENLLQGHSTVDDYFVSPSPNWSLWGKCPECGHWRRYHGSVVSIEETAERIYKNDWMACSFPHGEKDKTSLEYDLIKLAREWLFGNQDIEISNEAANAGSLNVTAGALVAIAEQTRQLNRWLESIHYVLNNKP
jgi:hypothetical protein